MTARTRILFFPDGQRVEVDPDYTPPARCAPAVHGVKEPFQSMADGRFYDDRRTYERSLRQQGYECVGDYRTAEEYMGSGHSPRREVGPPRRDDIERSLAELKAGRPVPRIENAQPDGAHYE